MILGEKEFKKPILDELGQNQTNIENWRIYRDQGSNLGRIDACRMQQLNYSYFSKANLYN